jgi:hypothetical protein
LSGPQLWDLLRNLEHADIPQADRDMLMAAFNALHGGQAIALPEDHIERIRELDAMFNGVKTK